MGYVVFFCHSPWLYYRMFTNERIICITGRDFSIQWHTMPSICSEHVCIDLLHSIVCHSIKTRVYWFFSGTALTESVYGWVLHHLIHMVAMWAVFLFMYALVMSTTFSLLFNCTTVAGDEGGHIHQIFHSFNPYHKTWSTLKELLTMILKY